LLRSLQEIQPDFEEEAHAHAGLWSQGKKYRGLKFKGIFCILRIIYRYSINSNITALKL